MLIPSAFQILVFLHGKCDRQKNRSNIVVHDTRYARQQFLKVTAQRSGIRFRGGELTPDRIYNQIRFIAPPAVKSRFATPGPEGNLIQCEAVESTFDQQGTSNENDFIKPVRLEARFEIARGRVSEPGWRTIVFQPRHVARSGGNIRISAILPDQSVCRPCRRRGPRWLELSDRTLTYLFRQLQFVQ